MKFRDAAMQAGKQLNVEKSGSEGQAVKNMFLLSIEVASKWNELRVPSCNQLPAAYLRSRHRPDSGRR
jgi:hypothetical protein